MPGFLSSRPNWGRPPPHPQASIAAPFGSGGVGGGWTHSLPGEGVGGLPFDYFLNADTSKKERLLILAIYGPMYVMQLLRANSLRGQVEGGWALEIETFLGPVKWHRAVRRVPFGAQKSP